MGNLIIGSDVVSIGLGQVDSIIPLVVTATKTLVPAVDRCVFADPSSGNIVLTLPTPAAGLVFQIHRIINGNNSVKITGQSINGQSNGVTLGLPDQFIVLVADVANNMYRLATPPPSQFSTLLRTSDLIFAATTSFVKYTSWETVVFSTPGVLLASISTDDIELQNFEGSVQMGYEINFTMNLEASNNNNCFARVVFDGAVGAPVVLYSTSQNGLGSGKSINLSLSGPVGVTEVGFFRIELQAESANNWTILETKFDIKRIVS